MCDRIPVMTTRILASIICVCGIVIMILSIWTHTLPPLFSCLRITIHHTLTLRDLFVTTAYFLSILQATQLAQKDFITCRAVATSTTHTLATRLATLPLLLLHKFSRYSLNTPNSYRIRGESSRQATQYHSSTYPQNITQHSGDCTHHRRNVTRGLHLISFCFNNLHSLLTDT
jgi:hypothetical protein